MGSLGGGPMDANSENLIRVIYTGKFQCFVRGFGFYSLFFNASLKSMRGAPIWTSNSKNLFSCLKHTFKSVV